MRNAHYAAQADIAEMSYDKLDRPRVTEREERIIRMRFVDGLTQAQVGARLRVSQMQASRLLRAILGRLRDHLVIDPRRPRPEALGPWVALRERV